MILSLFSVLKGKLHMGCLTTKNPTGTVTGLLDAPDCSALLASVRPPELKAYIFMPAGEAVCASEMEGTTRSARATLATRARILRFIRLSSAVRNFRSEDTTRRTRSATASFPTARLPADGREYRKASRALSRR